MKDKEITTFNEFRDSDIHENVTELDDSPIDSPEEITPEGVVNTTPAELPSISQNIIVNPKKLSDEVLKILNERLGDEYTAYFFYINAANWCKDANYKKASAFFENESIAELEHAKKIQNYITQWNLIPIIPQVITTYEFKSLIDIINKAYELEFGLLEKYSYNQIELSQLHPPTFNFIQKYVDIQNGEVEEYSDYLNALALINSENRLDLLYFENNYF